MVNAHDTENVSPDPVEFVLCLKPHQGSTKYNEVHATINIRFKLSETYPESSPTIQLEKGHGVSLKDIENLKKELEDLCDNGRGEEIGLVLAQHVQGFLAEKNKKPRFQSFHEEMVVAQQIEKERNALEKKSRMVEENNQQLMALEEEIKQKQPAFLIDLMKNRNKDVNTESLQQIPENNNLEEAVKVLVTCTLPKPLQIDFGNKYAEHVYDCGPCLGQCQPNRHVLSAVETKLKAFAVITHFKVCRYRKWSNYDLPNNGFRSSRFHAFQTLILAPSKFPPSSRNFVTYSKFVIPTLFHIWPSNGKCFKTSFIFTSLKSSYPACHSTFTLM